MTGECHKNDVIVMARSFIIPYGSWWTPGGTAELEFPDNWDVTYFKMHDMPELASREAIERAIDEPHGTRPLGELARGKKTAAIVIDDTSRSTELASILDVVLSKLNANGINDDDITVIAAVGAHRPMMRQDFIKKVGTDVMNRVRVRNHVPWFNTVYVGESRLGTPIHINKTYHEADLKISIGGVIPHPLAGYGGGAKIILPGISGIQTLEANHKLALTGRVGIGLGRITDVRKDIEDVGSIIGLDFSINVVPNGWGKNSAIFAGHHIDAHRKAIECCEATYRTPVKDVFNVGFFNAFPEDTELNQCVKALNVFLLNPAMVDRKGAIVIITASSEGLGYHALIAETGSPSCSFNNGSISIISLSILYDCNYISVITYY